LGVTVGAGIYVLVGRVAGVAGLYAPASFMVAAVLAGLSAFAFAEMN
jgi:amino acid transporter